MKHEIIIYWSVDDNAFIAEVPALPGCAADGSTYQEALDNVQVVIREWIETANELGRTPPEPKKAGRTPTRDRDMQGTSSGT
ncbi:MAG: type II toxin-antitoxin system HicB family antitoxin [Deltaproteobacteria bacterium]|nr:type II toxin-antitoxin system HicB family antitoxin [Deltaproteobacteria bacterium]